MKGFRRVLIADITWWVFLTLITLALAIGAALTPQDWSPLKIGLLVVVPVGIACIGVAAVVMTYSRKPDITICHLDQFKVYAWNSTSRSSSEVTDELADALDIFTDSLVEAIGAEDLYSSLDGALIEVRDEFISSWGIEAFSKPKAGLQRGKSIIFAWPPGYHIRSTAFVHELLHLVDEFWRGEVDYKHEDKEWWVLETLINEKILSR